MTDQKIIAQKRIEYSKFISVIIAFFGCAAFMVFMYFTDGDSDAYIALIVAAIFAAVALIPLFLLIREKRLPEVLIYLENGVLHFYNGYECRPEDIRDINSAYDSSSNNVVLDSGKITVYTDRGKIVCRRIKDLAYTTTAILSFKYGKVYTTEELKTKMAQRSAT